MVSGSGNGGVGSFGDPVGGWRVLRSLQQLLKLALFQLGIVSDFVERVRLHNLPVLKHGVQQVLEVNRGRNEARRSRRRPSVDSTLNSPRRTPPGRPCPPPV